MVAYDSSRQQLVRMYRCALRAVDGKQCTMDALQSCKPQGKTTIIAIGKAARTMLQGAMQETGDNLLEALLIEKPGYTGSAAFHDKPVTCLGGDHPVPGADSLAAGQYLIDFLRRQPDGATLLFLLSGGASSLVEVMRPGLSLQELQRAGRWLLGSGLDIAGVNRVRQALSAIKGGRLLDMLGGRAARALLISDVPDDDPAIIGSGLLFPEMAGTLPPGLPDWLEALCADALPVSSSARGVEHLIVANLDMALDAAANEARSLGYAPIIIDRELSGDVGQVSAAVMNYLASADPGVYLWGGEPTVRLPATPGIGGRCQQLALLCAQEIAMYPEVQLLVATTDGDDGNSAAAGAVIDAGTLQRCASLGLDVAAALHKADAGTCLAAAGDQLVTGPSGTNVRDIVIGMKRAG